MEKDQSAILPEPQEAVSETNEQPFADETTVVSGPSGPGADFIDHDSSPGPITHFDSRHLSPLPAPLGPSVNTALCFPLLMPMRDDLGQWFHDDAVINLTLDSNSTSSPFI